jgi:hypothetical protein
MDLEEAGATVRYLIRDRDAKFPPLFDEILAQAGIQVVLSGSRARLAERATLGECGPVEGRIGAAAAGVPSSPGHLVTLWNQSVLPATGTAT